MAGEDRQDSGRHRLTFIHCLKKQSRGMVPAFLSFVARRNSSRDAIGAINRENDSQQPHLFLAFWNRTFIVVENQISQVSKRKYHHARRQEGH
ncbi:hypothetical protein [Paraburkholderia rhizosphaerae]|uniref:hypothetical protein n=1 Tax=Paraburkholderia rhizosphaerae TaxID=480658 RepID=UPI0010649B7E|nr:hypothetical protein [Paraburkholderia rhizosphaerae]